MLQARTRTLDGTLRGKFEQWYPGLKTGDRSVEAEQRRCLIAPHFLALPALTCAAVCALFRACRGIMKSTS